MLPVYTFLLIICFAKCSLLHQSNDGPDEFDEGRWRDLLKEGENVNAESYGSETLLLYALSKQMATDRLKEIANHTSFDVAKHYLLGLDNSELWNFMLSNGFDINAVNDDDDIELNALGLAIEKNDINGVKKLLSYGANPNQRIGLGHEPLLFALKSNSSIKIVDALIERNVSIDDDWIFLALRSGQPFVKSLLTRDIDLNVRKNGVTAFEMILNLRNEDILTQIFKKSGNNSVLLNDKSSNNQPIVCVGDVNLNFKLFSRNQEFNPKEAVCSAFESDCIKFKEMFNFVKRNPNVKCESLNFLMMALKYENEEIFDLLLSKQVNTVVDGNVTPFSVAVVYNSKLLGNLTEHISWEREYLLALDTWTVIHSLENIKKPENNGLILAISSNKTELVKLLCDRYDLNHIFEFGSFIEIAILKKLYEIAKILNNSPKFDRKSQYRRAVEGNNVELLKFLMDMTENEQIIFESNQTALMIAAENGHNAVSDLLIERDESIVNQINNFGQHAITIACSQNHDELAISLANRKNLDVVVFLNSVVDQRQCLYLLNKMTIMKKDNNWAFLFWNAVHLNYIELIKIFSKTKKKQMSETRFEGESLLVKEVKSGKCQEMLMILVKNVNQLINIPSSTGWTPLMYASSKARNNCVNILLENGANALIEDEDGMSAILLAEKTKSHQTIYNLAQFEYASQELHPFYTLDSSSHKSMVLRLVNSISEKKFKEILTSFINRDFFHVLKIAMKYRKFMGHAFTEIINYAIKRNSKSYDLILFYANFKQAFVFLADQVLEKFPCLQLQFNDLTFGVLVEQSKHCSLNANDIYEKHFRFQWKIKMIKYVFLELLKSDISFSQLKVFGDSGTMIRFCNEHGEEIEAYDAKETSLFTDLEIIELFKFNKINLDNKAKVVLLISEHVNYVIYKVGNDENGQIFKETISPKNLFLLETAMLRKRILSSIPTGNYIHSLAVVHPDRPIHINYKQQFRSSSVDLLKFKIALEKMFSNVQFITRMQFSVLLLRNRGILDYTNYVKLHWTFPIESALLVNDGDRKVIKHGLIRDTNNGTSTLLDYLKYLDSSSEINEFVFQDWRLSSYGAKTIDLTNERTVYHTIYSSKSLNVLDDWEVNMVNDRNGFEYNRLFYKRS